MSRRPENNVRYPNRVIFDLRSFDTGVEKFKNKFSLHIKDFLEIKDFLRISEVNFIISPSQDIDQFPEEFQALIKEDQSRQQQKQEAEREIDEEQKGDRGASRSDTSDIPLKLCKQNERVFYIGNENIEKQKNERPDIQISQIQVRNQLYFMRSFTRAMLTIDPEFTKRLEAERSRKAHERYARSHSQLDKWIRMTVPPVSSIWYDANQPKRQSEANKSAKPPCCCFPFFRERQKPSQDGREPLLNGGDEGPNYGSMNGRSS